MTKIVKWLIRQQVKLYASGYLLIAWESLVRKYNNSPDDEILRYRIDQIKRMIYKKCDITTYIGLVETYGQAKILTPNIVLSEFIDYSLARNNQGDIDLCRRAMHGNLKAYIINLVMPLMTQKTQGLITEEDINYMTSVIEAYAIATMENNVIANA